MSDDILNEIIQKSDLLTPDEQLRLIADLAKKVRVRAAHEPVPCRNWSDLVGMLPYPACGEDAQKSISRSRRESDENRLVDQTL